MNIDAIYGPRSAWAHGGARALVMLHEAELRRFLVTWQRAKQAGLVLPEVDDPAYASMEALLHHVLRCSKLYLMGLCSMLEVEPPELADPPSLAPGASPAEELGPVEAGAMEYINAVLEAYRLPFRGATEEQFYAKSGEAPWGASYCVDAFFEHAVMHPLRHSAQLDLLLG